MIDKKSLQTIFRKTITHLEEEMDLVTKQEKEEIDEIIQKFKPVKERIEKEKSSCSKALVKMSKSKLNSENINIAIGGGISIGDNSKLVIGGKDSND